MKTLCPFSSVVQNWQHYSSVKIIDLLILFYINCYIYKIISLWTVLFALSVYPIKYSFSLFIHAIYSCEPLHASTLEECENVSNNNSTNNLLYSRKQWNTSVSKTYVSISKTVTLTSFAVLSLPVQYLPSVNKHRDNK